MQNSVTRALSISLTFAPWICLRILKNINIMKKVTTLFSTFSLVFLSLISMSSCEMESKKDIVATASESRRTFRDASRHWTFHCFCAD
jgi:hypothetical protein